MSRLVLQVVSGQGEQVDLVCVVFETYQEDDRVENTGCLGWTIFPAISIWQIARAAGRELNSCDLGTK